MLKLPDNWNSFTAGRLATYLLDQLGPLSLQTEFARTMIRGSLELMLEAIAIKRQHWLDVEATGYLEWRIRDAVYTYQPIIDNKSVNACTDLGMCTLMLSVIVPSGLDIAMRRCLDCFLGKRSPIVDTFSGFVSHRVLFASLDADWTHDETVLYLLTQFNKSIVDAKIDDSLIVDLPKNSSPLTGMP